MRLGQVAHETETVIYAWALRNFKWVVVAVVSHRSGCRWRIKVQDYGIPLAEVARHLGVSMSAISKAITRRTKE